jgi:electron transfer flavoprotein beta subunit
MALEAPEVEDALFAALAKGADRAIKVTGGMETRTTREAAAVLAEVVATEPNLASADMVLTGVQAIDDLDGLIAPLLADRLAMPYLGIVTRLEVDPAGTTATALKEYPDGYRGEFEVSLPAVFGMQAAERPPRYVPVAKVRATRKSQTIECIPAPGIPEHLSMVRTLAMGKPAAGEGAQIFEGSPEVVCGKLCGVLAERGLL